MIVSAVSDRSRQFLIEETGTGVRADVYLAQHLDLSRSRIQKLCEDRSISLNGKSCKPSAKLKTDDLLDVRLPPPDQILQALPQPIDLNIVFEDEHLVVVDKPAGLVVHPGAGHPDSTLVNGLLHHCGRLAQAGSPQRPGIVHRIDKDTSGLVVVAKTDQAYYHLQQQFSGHSILREYRCWVFGAMDEESGEISSMIGRHPNDRKRFASRRSGGKHALTHWRILHAYGDEATALKIRLETGRTHQIRVHLSERNHPLIGDGVYGGKGRHKNVQDTKLRSILAKFPRQALHARLLGFHHPATDELIRFKARLPKDLMELETFLQSHFTHQG